MNTNPPPMQSTLDPQTLLFLGHDEGRSGAVLSKCGTYRYRLDRWWGDGDCVVWVMLNPSTADSRIDDPTIRKCKGFSQRWGYGRMIILNLFALRSTDPRALARNTDPVGVQADYYIYKSLEDAAEVVFAWGCQQHLTTPKLRARIDQVVSMIGKFRPDADVSCLGYRKDGAPRHPLMLSYETQREPFCTALRKGMKG